MHHDGARPVGFEEIAVDLADAHDQAVGLRGFAQPLLLLPACRGHQRPVLAKRAVHEVLDVLRGAPLLLGVAPGRNLLGAEFVVDEVAAFVDQGEITAANVGIFFGAWLGPVALEVRLGDPEKRVAGVDPVPLGDQDRIHYATALGADDVVEFQRVDRCDRLSGAHLVALGHVDRDNGARHGRDEGDGAAGPGCAIVLLGFDVGVVFEQRERILGIRDPCAGEAVRGGGVVLSGRRDEASRGLGTGEFAQVLVDEPRVDASGGEVGVAEDGVEEGDVGLDALDAELGQRPRGARHGVGEVVRRRVADHLGEQRVVVEAGLVAGVAEAVGAHARAARRLVGGQGPARRQDGAVVAHRLHAHPRLDRVAARRARLAEAELGDRGAPREAELRLDDVHPGDLLGHRVLHLQPRVGLDEGERAACFLGGVDQELEGAGVAVADARREAHRGVDEGCAHRVVEAGRRGHLDDLLEVPLHAALAFAEVGDGAVNVAEDLHLDVARAAHELLDVHVAVAERRLGLGAAALVDGGDVVGALHHARTPSAAAADRLDHHGAAVRQTVEECLRLGDRHGMVDAVHDRHVGRRGGGAGARLVAEELERLDARADEGQPGLGAGAGEAGVLGEEAVAGMHGVAARLAGGGDDGADVEVGGRARAVEDDHVVGLAGVQGARVVARRHRHRRHVQFRRRAHDADGDLAPVRYQKLHSSSVPRNVRLHRNWRIVRCWL